MNYLVVIFAIYFLAGIVGLKLKRTSYGLVAIGSAITMVLLFLKMIPVAPTSWYFLLLSSLIWLFMSLFSLGYDVKDGILASTFGFTTSMMFLIMISQDAITFLAGWEGMTVASFISLYSHKKSSSSAYLFLGFGELSTLFILSGFSYAYSLTGSLLFSSWTHVHGWSAIYFLLAMGFTIKMAVFPFHIWLPEAHSKAPANMSAQLSAIMTLMGVYGLIMFSGISLPAAWVGTILLILGGITAIWGAFYASVTDHVKRLPAYSTVENDGVLIALTGAFIITLNFSFVVIASFVLVSLLFYSFAHSVSKALLFSIAGKLEKSGSEALGGKSSLTRVGAIGGYIAAISLSGVPPFPGFVGEWMAIESMFQAFYFSNMVMKVITVLVGALVALTAGVSMIAMSKFVVHGVGRSVRRKYEVSDVGIIIGAAVIVVLGAMPQMLFYAFSPIVHEMTGVSSSRFIGGLLGIPNGTLIISGNGFGVLSPTMLFVFIIGIFFTLYIFMKGKFLKHAKITRAWSGGLHNDEYPTRAHSSILLSTQKWLYRTTSDFNFTDVVHCGYVSLGHSTFSFSEWFRRILMPGKDRQYVLYILLTLFTLLIIVALSV